MVHTGLRASVLPTPDPKLDQLLRTAIEQTKLLRLRYRNRDRIVEPHDYGVHNGVIKLLTWQIAGSSSSPLPNWRWMETDRKRPVRTVFPRHSKPVILEEWEVREARKY